MGRSLKWLMMVVILAGGLRLFNLSKSPPSVNWDEAAFGYNAYSLSQTGKDEYGSKLPLSFRSFDDYKPPLYVYMTAGIVKIWGLSEVTTRLVGAICGVLAVILIYLAAVSLTGSRKTALLASLMMALEPWSVNQSRMAYEADVALVLFLAAVYLLEKAKSTSKYYLPAIFLAMLSSFAYNSGKVYLVLTLVWLVLNLKKKILDKKLILGVALILAPVILAAGMGSSLARFSSTSIFKLWTERKSAYLFAGEVVNRYVGYYSPVNIFVRGTNEPIQSVHGFGVFYAFEAIFFLLGLGVIFKSQKISKQLKWWVMVGPIPAVLTWSWFSPVRIQPFWAMIVIVNAVGAVWLWGLIKNKYLKIIIILGVGGWWLVNAVWLMSTLLWYMPYEQYGQWQYGFREAIETIKPIMGNYDQIIWESPQAQPYIFTLFYLQYPPADYHQDLVLQGGVPIPRTSWDFGKFKFRKIYWPEDRGLKKTLFVGGVYSLPDADLKRDHAKIIKEVTDPQGYVVYRIVGY